MSIVDRFAKESEMARTGVHLPNELLESLDKAAKAIGISRDQLIREALENHLEDLDDIRIALARSSDENDATLDWLRVKSNLLDH
jgi:predicted DNA-binding protein